MAASRYLTSSLRASLGFGGSRLPTLGAAVRIRSAAAARRPSLPQPFCQH